MAACWSSTRERGLSRLPDFARGNPKSRARSTAFAKRELRLYGMAAAKS